MMNQGKGKSRALQGLNDNQANLFHTLENLNPLFVAKKVSLISFRFKIRLKDI